MEEEKIKQEHEEVQQVWSWGAGTDGQLGTGRLEDDYSPQLLSLSSPTDPFSLLACGGAHVIALTTGGKVLTWGRGTSGQLGHGEVVSTLVPKIVTFFQGHRITQVAAGWSHSAFVSDTGSLFTCGDGSFGQLGHGDYRSHCSPVKVSYFVNKTVQQVACGMRHSLVLLADCPGNQVYGFGFGKRGQLGISSDRIKSVNIPQITCGFDNVDIVTITANGDHSAALSADGHLYTWGRGFNSSSDVQCPRAFPSSLEFTQVALGWNHALLLSGDDEVFMLGGTLGGVKIVPEKSTSEHHLRDTHEGELEEMSGVEKLKVVRIASGAEHSALVTAKGDVRTWGWGEHGQLGHGNTNDQTIPQTLVFGDQVLNRETKVFCGSGFTFVLLDRLQHNQ